MYLTQRQIEIVTGHICPYCGNKPQYVDSSIVYGVSYGMIYLCSPCDAYVGVHKGTDTPLGRLSNADLRYWKKQAHEYFDRLWESGNIKRSYVYQMLQEHLQIPKEYCHIGMFSEDTCKRVIEWVKSKETEPPKPKKKPYKTPEIRKKPATRFNSRQEHDQYGIFKWFAKRGIESETTIIDCMKEYMQSQRCVDMGKGKMFSYIQNRFSNFASFAKKYIINLHNK